MQWLPVGMGQQTQAMKRWLRYLADGVWSADATLTNGK